MHNLPSASLEHIRKGLESLNEFNSTPGCGTTRILFTKEELGARKLVKEMMRQLDLMVWEDAIGNIYGRLLGSEQKLSPVWTGSHIDTVIHGGKFDGMTGVIGALEAIRMIKEAGVVLRRNIDVIVFTSEEPTRFGKGCIGSRALAGFLTLQDAREMEDGEGESLAGLLSSLGYELEDFHKIPMEKDSVYAFVELHIEQAIVLEQLQIPIGVVTTISAPTDIQVALRGKQGHAGATPMNLRRDAVTAAAEIILHVERLANISDSPNTVATVGKINVNPNASNVIPGEVLFTIDIRDSDFETKDKLVKELESFIGQVRVKRQVEISCKIINHDIPRQCAPKIIQTIKEVCRAQNYQCHDMVSGAYHDAMLVGEFSPIGMIFVPSKEGISHNPEEWTDDQNLVIGVNVLAHTLVRLADSLT